MPIVPKELQDIIFSGWNQIPDARPTMNEIVHVLDSVFNRGDVSSS